jgi:hypothetical protein
MYAYLEKRLGRSAAAAVVALAYAVLIALVLYSVFEPQTELKYLAL